MIKKNVLEGISVLPSPPRQCGVMKPPVVVLEKGLILDDRIFECPTLILGAVGTGKTYLLKSIMSQILKEAEKNNDNVIIFCVKKDMLSFKRDGDIVISIDSKEPASCWNIFREMAASPNPVITAKDIISGLIRDQKSSLQPFFTNACNIILSAILVDMYEDGLKKGIMYSNWHFVDFLNNLSLSQNAELSWYDLPKIRPETYGHILDFIGDCSSQAYGVLSEIRIFLKDFFIDSFCSADGEFSAIETLKSGGKRIFLYYNYAHSSDATIKILTIILTLLLKHAVDEDNLRKSWFFLDEMSLLPKQTDVLIDVMSLGREAGVRIIGCIQSAKNMTRHYQEDQAAVLLSLFPNLICLKVQDEKSRELLSERYGDALISYSFNASLQKDGHQVESKKAVTDYDFLQIQNKGDAIMSIPNLCNSPFFYSGYRKEIEKNEKKI